MDILPYELKFGKKQKTGFKANRRILTSNKADCSSIRIRVCGFLNQRTSNSNRPFF